MTNPDISTWFGIATTAYSDAPMLWYSFDDSTASDKGSNGVNGVLANTPTFGAGKFGNAINFDGSQKRIVVDNTNIPK
jgi:hypothetical protein